MELFFDLTVVVAVARAAAGLHHALADGRGVWPTVGAYAAAFFAIYWAWMNFTWFASAYDTDDVLYRVLTLVTMAGALVMAAGVDRAFERSSYTVMVVGYVIMRLAMVVQWLRAASSDPLRRHVDQRYAIGIASVQILWIARLWFPSTVSNATFIVLALAEMAVPVWAERSGPTTSWHPRHITERYGLFTIIVLGEVVAAATVAVEDAVATEGLSFAVLRLLVGGLLLVFALWWLYFERQADDTLGGASANVLTFVWGYGQYFVFAAAAAVGAGLEVAIAALQTASHHGEPVREVDAEAAHGVAELLAGLAVAVPVVIYLLVLGAVHLKLAHVRHDGDAVHPALVGGAAVAVLVTGALAGTLGIATTVLLVGLEVTAIVVVDGMRTHRSHRTHHRQPAVR